MINTDNLSNADDEESKFDKVYKMTKHELEQQNTNMLVEHIIDLKKKISNRSKFDCVCGGVDDKSDFCGDCYNCNRPMCGENGYYSEFTGCCIKCSECGTENCIDCSKKCKFSDCILYCKTHLCNICIKNYPDWDLIGCKFVCHGYNDRYKKPTKGIYFHCILPYCGDTNYFENVCTKHYDDLEKFIIENLDFLPNDLIKICLGYFFIKMNKENWNTREMELIREYEFDKNNYYVKSNRYIAK